MVRGGGGSWARSAGTVLFITTLSYCGPVGCGSGCDEFSRTGLNVTVVDASNNTTLCNATVSATDSSGITLELDRTPNNCMFVGATERAGTYTVVVSAPGYESATLTNVRVVQGECHVERTTFTVSLSPN
jgi:hypothetical protein